MAKYVKKPKRSLIERFLEKIEIDENGCWLWQGGLVRGRYGKFAVKTSTYEQAHRWSFKFFKGEIPEGLEVHHDCVVPQCVNPDHLIVTTPAENKRLRGLITHCKRGGHEYTEDNTYWSKGLRSCKTCKRETDSNRVRKNIR